MTNTRILFILKQRNSDYMDVEDKNPEYSKVFYSGLYNSADQIKRMLSREGVQSRIESVVDNNCIDSVVSKYKPTHVVIEALWVVPEKFKILKKLHPTVKWIVRLHSETPFIANEGIAIDWIFKYVQEGVVVSPNSKRLMNDLRNILPRQSWEHVKYLPNYYEISKRNYELNLEEFKNRDVLDIGCFGAIRPFKNQLLQAIAAIGFTDHFHNHKKLRFHMNCSRIEQKGDNVLKNIRSLFAAKDPKKYELVEHSWVRPENFIEIIRKMDLGLQVSFTETFNVVSADFVTSCVPIVVSNEVAWMPEIFQASTTNVDDIMYKMNIAMSMNREEVAIMNIRRLMQYNDESMIIWNSFLGNKC